MDSNTVVMLAVVAIVVYSISLHELAHAYAATWCGDPTPGRNGRLTWNPIVQLHPFYSIALPIISYFLMGWPFGFAFTPIDPSRFRRPLRDRALVGISGPLVNFLLMALLVGLLWIPGLATPPSYDFPGSYNFPVFFYAAYFNLLLGVFNLLPIPGLDGYDVIRPALPLSLRQPLDNLRRMGLVPMLLIFFLGPRLLSAFWYDVERLFLKLVPGGGW
jgi:Zn-dependent protease